MLRALWRSIPAATRFGLALAWCGVIADLVHHVVAPVVHAGQNPHIGSVGHVLTLAGMVVALLGVMHAAVGSRRRTRERRT